MFEDTLALEVKDGEPCRVVTERGTITARDVLLATHAPLGNKTIQTKVAQYRSYVLGCRVAGPARRRGSSGTTRTRTTTSAASARAAATW